MVDMVSFVFHLPPELLVEILSYLGCRDLYNAGLACRCLHSIVKCSLELQYNIELAADGMVDGPRGPGTLPIARRLELLLERRERWRTLTWSQQVNIPMKGNCQAYELVGGVFAKSMNVGTGGSRHLITTWLPSSTQSAHSIIREDLGVSIRDFAMDPSQDLIALVNVDDSTVPTVSIRVHLRTMSTNTPHKGAAKAELYTPVPLQIGNCFIQIVNDVVALFFWLHGPAMIIWNWRTGDTMVACLPDDRPLGAHDPTSQSHAIAAELNPGTWDFAFLSDRAYILTTIGGRGSIEIYAMRSDTIDKTSPTTHVASLSLPVTKDGSEMHQFSTHSSPFLGGDVTKSKPFAVSDENRVHLMSFHYGQQGPRYHMFIKNDFLLGFVKNFDGRRKTLRWEEWGPDNTRFKENPLQYQWLRYIHGQRVVLPPIPISGPPNPLFRICIIDFNVHPKRLDDPCPIGYTSENDKQYKIVDTESRVSAGAIFEADVVSRLPYSFASKMGHYLYSGFLLDEERLVGMKYSMGLSEGDLSDIDVFTF